ncbi:MAG: 3-deoxy-8-phosphooctulonate synthase [Acidobacteriales bacterium]|nr:3-deoxy-8-phosphooctulonate synthase [Terriglobales bacterium]
MSKNIGRPLAYDSNAASASDGVPGFIARPEGTPVYHGFRILEDVQVEGFRFGMITNFEAQETNEGDAFVVAPDDSRAGLVWDIGSNLNFEEVLPFEASRWGVWAVSLPHPMRTRDDAKKNLESIVPALKEKWQEWLKKFPGERR